MTTKTKNGVRPEDIPTSAGGWLELARERVAMGRCGYSIAGNFDRIAEAASRQGQTFPWIFGTGLGAAHPSHGVVSTAWGAPEFRVFEDGEIDLEWEAMRKDGAEYRGLGWRRGRTYQWRLDGTHRPSDAVRTWIEEQVEEWRPHLVTEAAMAHARLAPALREAEAATGRVREAAREIERIQQTLRGLRDGEQAALETLAAARRKFEQKFPAR